MLLSRGEKQPLWLRFYRSILVVCGLNRTWGYTTNAKVDRYRVFAARVCLSANCINTTVNKSHSSLRYATTEDSRSSTALCVIRREFRSSPEFLLADSHISVFSRTTGISVYLLFICIIWLVLHLTIMYG